MSDTNKSIHNPENSVSEPSQSGSGPNTTRDEQIVQQEFEGLDNDLVDVSTFTNRDGVGHTPGPEDTGADRPGLSDEPNLDTSNTLQKP